MDPKEALQKLVEVAGELKLSKKEHEMVISWGQCILDALVAGKDGNDKETEK